MMPHIEGMGVLGSLIALDLEAQGIFFSWHDIEAPIAAWPACTGCIYPSGNADEQAAYAYWAANYFNLPQSEINVAPYWYATRQPPNGNKWKPVRVVNSLSLAPEPSYHINAQALVTRVRERFATSRLGADEVPQHCPLIRAHGFGPRLHHYLWGWSREVDLPGLSDLLGDKTPAALHLQEGRFKMLYAYPRPGTKHWYAGSVLQYQQTPKPLDAGPKYDAWAEHVFKYTGIVPEEKGPLLQGWRPVGAQGDNRLKIEGRVCTVPSLGHSGVRLAPLVAVSLRGWLQEQS